MFNRNRIVHPKRTSTHNFACLQYDLSYFYTMKFRWLFIYKSSIAIYECIPKYRGFRFDVLFLFIIFNAGNRQKKYYKEEYIT